MPETKPTPRQLLGAFEAWMLAIRAKFNGVVGDAEKLAADYGRDITTAEALAYVRPCFNLDEIRKHGGMFLGPWPHTDRAEGRASVHLIAAAPDLLAACRAVLDRHNYQGDGRPWSHLIDTVRAAVTKAGGAPPDLSQMGIDVIEGF